MVWNGRIIGKANKSCLAVYKEMEQQFIAIEENSITNKFQKNFATFTAIAFCYKLVKQLL